MPQSNKFEANKIMVMLTKRNAWIGFGLLIAVLTVVYSNHFHNSFHFDDSHTIQSNIYIQNIKNIPLFFKDGATFSSLPSNQSYRPVLSTSLAIDYWLGNGLTDTFQFHLTSYLLFVIIGALLFLFYQKILSFSEESPTVLLVSLIATAFYLLHPACAETVNYIIQRGDMFAAFFLVLGFVLYAYVPLCRQYYLYLPVIFIGILAKPNTLVFAPLFLIYQYLFEYRLTGKDIVDVNKYGKVIFASLGAFAVCILAYLFMSAMQSESYAYGGYDRLHYIATQPFILFYYFSAWFAPIGLNADTDWSAFPSVVDPRAIFGFVFIAILLTVAFITSNYKRSKPIAFGILWFLVGNLPTSLLPFSEIMNDHRMFMPFVGLTLAAVWSIYLLAETVAKQIELPQYVKYSFYAFVGLALLGFAYGTHTRNEVWKTEETLWKDCAVKSPENGRGLMNYGLALMSRGDYKTAEMYFQRGLDAWPTYSYLHVNMGVLKSALGKSEEAEKFFLSGIQFGGGYPNSHYFYARFLKEKGRKDEAIRELKKTLEMAKANSDARYMLMEILFEEGRFEELKQIASETLAILPNDAKSAAYLASATSGKSKLQVAEDAAKLANTPQAYLDLSLQYYQAGKFDKCIEAGNEALKLKPDFAAAYNNIGSAYNSMGKFAEGKAALTKSLAIDPSSQLAKNNLAWAESELKKAQTK